MKLLRLLIAILFLCHLAGHAQNNITAIASPAGCMGDGKITVISGSTEPLIYYVISDSDYFESENPTFENLESGDYLYGYYNEDFTIWEESPETISVGNICSGISIKASSTVALCPGTGTITVSVTNLEEPIVYAVAKLPYSEANIITSGNPVITNLDEGDYYYGYFKGATFVKSSKSISVVKGYTTDSPSISSVTAKNFTYCPSGPDPLGEILVTYSHVNGPPTISLLNVLDGSEVKSGTGINTYCRFINVAPGEYKVKLVDRCGVVVIHPSSVILNPNIPLTDFIFNKRGIIGADIVYNSAGNVCSGINSASIKMSDVASSALMDGTVPAFYGDRFSYEVTYKLEIQNENTWEVYDNLSWVAGGNFNKNFPLLKDRSKWGLVRMTATICGVSKTIVQDYGSSSLAKSLSFDRAGFSFDDDPANTNCTNTGKVRLRVSIGSNMGCSPYILEATDNETNDKTTYTSIENSIGGHDFSCLLLIGKTYSFKLTDSSGAEPLISSFSKYTGEEGRYYNLGNNLKSLFIDPVSFAPAQHKKVNIQFYTGPSGKNFGKSILVAKIPDKRHHGVGLEGKIMVILESGPSAFDIVENQVDYNAPFELRSFRFLGLGNNLMPGNYKIRIKDSGCFDEVFDVVLDSYFTGIKIKDISSVPDTNVCDRYIKKVTAAVDFVGSGSVSSDLEYIIGGEYVSYVYASTVVGPVMGTTTGKVVLKGGVLELFYDAQVSGNYEIGLTRTGHRYTFLQRGELWENTMTVPLEVLSKEFPVFDLSASGGIICTGNTTGDLYTKVDNLEGTVTYFIKKDTDVTFPATGQESPVFKGLIAGTYVVKVKTKCFEVEQPLILRPSLTKLVSGTTSFCEGGSLWLSLNPMIPLTGVKWTAPDGTIYNTKDLKLDHLKVSDSGIYKVEANSYGGCYFFEFVDITMNNSLSPTGQLTQEFCKKDNPTIADLVTSETDVRWYDAADGGSIIPSSTSLVNGTTYYGTLYLGDCESSSRLAVKVVIKDLQAPTGASIQEFCKADNKTVANLKTAETGVTWYDAATNGNVVPPTTVLTDGTIYYGSLKEGSCESPTRLAVTATLSDPQAPTTAHTTQEFCKMDNKTVADLETTESGVTWYDDEKDGNVISPTAGLENNKLYYGSLKVGTCESPTRLAVKVTLSDPQTPTVATIQEFCGGDNKTVADLKTIESGVTWYDAEKDGNVILPTTVLSDGTIYYGSLKVGTCESPTRLAVKVTLSDPQTPTTTNTTQEFCKVDNKTVADLETKESGVTWYDVATNGNVVPSTAILTDGTIYYGSLKVGTCESPTRLAVTVTLSDPQTPTTTNTTQEFCKVDNKTVADLVTTESGVTWYDDEKDGNVISPTAVLENNKVYYGSLKVGTCESPTRLAVTVILTDPQTPAGATTQEFCKGDNKTIADLETTESGVTWYDAATNGNVVPPTTVLTDGTIYYGSLKEVSCESLTRLAVTVTLSDPQAPTTAHATQEFCKVDNKIVADLATTESGVIWYDDEKDGSVIPPTAVLENNKVYYGSLKAGSCESPTRLAVKVILSDPQTPTGATTQEFCKADNKTVADLVTTKSGLTWYDAEKDGNVVPPTAVLTDGAIYYGSVKEGTCESPTRLAVKVILSDPQTPTTTNTTQEFCKVDNKTIADLATTESGVTWYDDEKDGSVIPPTAFLENNKVYYGSLKVGSCESPTRLAVKVILSDPQTPTGATTQEFCKVDNKTVADLETRESDVTWYHDAAGIDALASTTVLENNKIYYGSLKAETCESSIRLAVKVILSDPQTPTGATTQEFCKVDNKTVADLETRESDVTWYDAATGVNALTSTTVLENNKIYYGSLKAGTCKSPIRLAVKVILSDPQTPTGATTQEFCKADNKTIADLVTTESDVTWYDAEKDGNVVPPTTVLSDGTIYYGSLKVGTCKSTTRLAVTVIIWSDPQTPTGATTQEFCKADNKTVADLVITESDVTWYDAVTNGNVVPTTTILENNKVYYGSLKLGNCESSTRLAVTVTLSDPQTPTGATKQEFCKVDKNALSDLVTVESGVTWYDAATNGNVLPFNAVLENNKVYYGSLRAGNCESPTRLAVTVILSDPQTPTGATTQEFCEADSPKVSDLITTETGITWYDAAKDGKAIAATTALKDGAVYYGSLKTGTCESRVRLAIKVVIKKNYPVQIPDWNTKACVFDEITYKAVSGMSDYNWLITNEGDIISGGQPTDDYVTILWNNVGKAVIKVDYIDISKCDPIVSVNFHVTVGSCSDIGLEMTVDNATPGIGQHVVFNVTAENFGINNSKEIVIDNMLPSGYEYIVSNVSKGRYDRINGIWSMPILKSGESQNLMVTAKVKGRGDYLNVAYLKASNPEDINETNNRAQASVRTKDIVIYNALSTNEDGINDYFRIEGLDQYPNNTVEIFNAGGIQIFKTNNYGSNNNVFHGISEGRATVNKKTGVSTGTYYYILRYEAEGTMMEKAGYLYVNN